MLSLTPTAIMVPLAARTGQSASGPISAVQYTLNSTPPTPACANGAGLRPPTVQVTVTADRHTGEPRLSFFRRDNGLYGKRVKSLSLRH